MNTSVIVKTLAVLAGGQNLTAIKLKLLLRITFHLKRNNFIQNSATNDKTSMRRLRVMETLF